MTKKCSVEGCDRDARGRGMCQAHYMIWYKQGGKDEPKLRRAFGEGTIHNDGYIQYSRDGKVMGEHRWLAEKALGKPLPPGAIVHHVNGRPWDNRPENLVICPDQEYHRLLHKRQRELGITFDEDN